MKPQLTPLLSLALAFAATGELLNITLISTTNGQPVNEDLSVSPASGAGNPGAFVLLTSSFNTSGLIWALGHEAGETPRNLEPVGDGTGTFSLTLPTGGTAGPTFLRLVVNEPSG